MFIFNEKSIYKTAEKPVMKNEYKNNKIMKFIQNIKIWHSVLAFTLKCLNI